jgi:hypothetical protein
LSLTALASVSGCVGDGAPAGPVASRNVALWDPPLAMCLSETKLALHHADGTTDVASDVSAGLAEHARAGDQIDLSFVVAPGCIAEHGPRLTLATYTTQGITTFGMKQVDPPRAYDVHTARFEDGVATLTARIPDCFFQIELAFGEPLARLGPPGATYEGEKREIAAVQGGGTSCAEVPALAISAFDTVERGWGDAPLLAHLGWNIAGDKGLDQLTCELDFEGDGKVDQVLSPCPANTAEMKVAALPVHTWTAPGEHRPEFVVSDGTRRLWAGTSVLANHLEFKPDVRFPEDHWSFTGAELTRAVAPELSELALHYGSLKDMPQLAVGDVVVGKGGDGYMLRVVKLSKIGATLYVAGLPVGLDETVAGGYFGIRDYQVPTGDIRCVSDKCVGTVTPIPAPPGGDAQIGETLALDAANQLMSEETKFGIKVAVPLLGGSGGESAGEIEMFIGLVVEKFAIDGLVSGPLRVDIRFAPTIEAALSVMAALSHEFELGKWFIAMLPTPLPVAVNNKPVIAISAATKFTGKLTAALKMMLVHDENGWDHRFDPELKGFADVVGVGTELSFESKATLKLPFMFTLGFLDGPYVAPTGALGIKGAVNPDKCELCVTAFGELGAELGWEMPWGLGTIFDQMSVSLLEHEFKKRCEPFMDGCEDLPETPPQGGTFGDVHALTYDGLMFDFQAGGEFVLTRALPGEPPLEIQARQQPAGTNLSLSYNTAIAARVGERRVGFYVGMPERVYVDDDAQPLLSGEDVEVGGALLVRDGFTYKLSWPTGEVLTVHDRGGHLDVAVALPAARAGKVEGVLGDGDTHPENDVGLGGGAYIPQPVTFEQLYRGPESFTAAWRVAPAATLFVYPDGEGPEDYGEATYGPMPISTPAALPEHIAAAVAACGECPGVMRDACMLDVAFTGDPSFADACAAPPGTPTEAMYPADQFIPVSPRYGSEIDCADARIVFRGPDLADADVYPGGRDLIVRVQRGFNEQSDWAGAGYIDTTEAPPNGTDWGDRFVCTPIGDGTWGECTLRFAPGTGPCGAVHYPLYRYIITPGLGAPESQQVKAYFTRPVPPPP